MTHLTPEEIVDLLEDALDDGRAAHVDVCEGCRARAAAARAALADAQAIDAPEPSPLFWEHFSARVRAALAVQPAQSRRWTWLTSPASAVAGACAVVLLSVVAVWLRSPAVPAEPEALVAETPAGFEWLDVSADDEAWDLLVTLTAGLAWEDASEAGLAVRPGAIDRAVLSLTADERSALARLLEEALADHM